MFLSRKFYSSPNRLIVLYEKYRARIALSNGIPIIFKTKIHHKKKKFLCEAYTLYINLSENK
jgi:hypothetical protein